MGVDHATISIKDLPELGELLQTAGLTNFSEGFKELFALDTRMLRYGDEALVVFRNEDLRRLAAHPHAGNVPAPTMLESGFSGDEGQPVAPAQRQNISRLMSNQLFTANPPVHGPVRQIYVHPFGPKAMPAFEPIAERAVAGLVERFAGAGEIDFSLEFAERLTAQFWGEVLGLTPQEQERIVQLVRAMLPWFMIVRSQADVVQLDTATAEYLEILTGALRRQRQAGNSLLETMAQQFEAITEPNCPESFEMSLACNWVDAFHTAALAATNAVYHLLRNPEALQAVRGDASLVSAAVAEGLRMSSPVLLTPRYALEAFDYEGVHIPQGTALVMLWAAGNRDPQIHPDGDAYDLTRAQRNDTGTGGGPHICPGRFLARMIAAATIDGLTSPGVEIRLTGSVEWMPRSGMWQPFRLPVVIERV